MPIRHPDLGALSQPFAAGTFLFRDPTRLQTSPPGGTIAVAIAAGGFDLQEDNNFGVQPFSTISGTIAAQPWDDGQLGPNATPQDGVTVQLVQDGIVVGSTTSGTVGGYTFAGLRPGSYSVQQVVPAGYRQVAPYASNFQLQVPRTWRSPARGRPYGEKVVAADFDGNGRDDLAVLAIDPHAQLPAMVWVFYDGDLSNPVGLSLGGGESFYEVSDIITGSFGAALPGLAVLYADIGAVAVLSNHGGRPQNGSIRGRLPLPSRSQYRGLVQGNFRQGEGVPGGQLAAFYFEPR
ncbi:MAG: SdrD B-like domain-containing protein [Singulisphaera sp.]